MAGIFFFLLLATWLAIDATVVIRYTSKFRTKWRVPIVITLITILAPLPFADEIIGGLRFKKLCEDSKLYVSPASAGRTVFLADEDMVLVEDRFVRIARLPWRYLDTATNETVIAYDTFVAGGGIFKGLTQGAPLLFDGECLPVQALGHRALLAKYQVILIDRRKLQK